jgi:hypothetical protein
MVETRILTVDGVFASMEWQRRDEEAVVGFWLKRALNPPPGSNALRVFQGIIARANLPAPFNSELAGLTVEDAETTAWDLFRWALAKGVNPKEPEYFTLASLLLPSLARVGVDEASEIVAVLVKYGLLRGKTAANNLMSRYQVPVYSGQQAHNGPLSVGPDITWRGPGTTEELELQGLLKAPLDFDVGFLRNAIRACASICRVEHQGRAIGTGFAVGQTAVLTNYHVLSLVADDVENVACGIKLRFGAMTSTDANVAGGQVVGTLAATPMYGAFSPPSEYDFVLLQTDCAVASLIGLTVAELCSEPPTQGTSINLVHHSEGGPMRLQISNNGISTVSRNAGLVQYASRASGGSSGAPCFDDQFRVVALHHAARSTLWGVAGEGILAGPIIERIRDFLE